MDKNKKENIEKIEELYQDLDAYKTLLKEEEKRKKNRVAAEILEMGEVFIEEINNKHQKRENERLKMIDFIINKKKKSFKREKLLEMSYEEINSIYIKINSSKAWYKILIESLMGW